MLCTYVCYHMVLWCVALWEEDAEKKNNTRKRETHRQICGSGLVFQHVFVTFSWRFQV